MKGVEDENGRLDTGERKRISVLSGRSGITQRISILAEANNPDGHDMEIHLLQSAIERGQAARNRDRITALAGGLRAGRSAMLVLPELFSTGCYDQQLLADQDPAAWRLRLEEDQAFLSALAKRLGCWVAGTTAGGEAPQKGRGGEGPWFQNISLLFDPMGTCRARYHKIHPFSFGGEDLILRRGRDVIVLEAEGWMVQPTICYDLRFPELYRAGSLLGANLILVQANWPAARQAHWEALLIARAIENQAFVAGVNCVGTQGSLVYGGGSMLISPRGEILAKGGAEEGGFCGVVDRDALRAWRESFPALRDRMPPGFYLREPSLSAVSE